MHNVCNDYVQHVCSCLQATARMWRMNNYTQYAKQHVCSAVAIHTMQDAHVRNTCSLHAHKQCMLCTQVAYMLRIYEVWWNLAHVLHLVHMAHVQHSLHHRCSTCAAHIHFCKGMIHKNYISVAGSYCDKPNSLITPE